MESLLKMTTGWDLGHLSSLVGRQKEEALKKQDQLLKEIDEKRSKVRYSCSAEMKHVQVSSRRFLQADGVHASLAVLLKCIRFYYRRVTYQVKTYRIVLCCACAVKLCALS